jgi:[acyl-carrier-protein] S-malonyltransferase
VLILVAPGQGAQSPGFLTPWLELDGVADRLRWWSAVCGLDLARYGTEADTETIRDTAVAQPLLVAAGLIGLRALFPDPGAAAAAAGAMSGHSVGELTAVAGCGVLSEEAALVLARQRGLAMADAAARTATGMTAVLGGDPEQVDAALAAHGLTPANHNGAGQVVAAGTAEQLAALAAAPPERAKLVPLSVAGAFHTEHMRPAVATLDALMRGVPAHDAATDYVSNLDGAVVRDGRDITRRLVAQVASPVRWDLCMARMRELGVTAVIEVPPAGTLTNLIKRALPDVARLALKTPDDLDKARELVAEHGGVAAAVPSARPDAAPDAAPVSMGV